MLTRIPQLVPFVLIALSLTVGLGGCAVLRGGKISATDAVTTSIRDVYPTAYWMNYYTAIRSPEKGTSFNLAPGYYTFDIQSYCLKAGTYAPTAGSGYLIAPLKGERAKIIGNILRRSAEHPGVKQRDIQRLIWGIETGANFSKYDTSFQLRVSPVLSPAEIATLSVDYEEWLSELLPDDLKEAVELYNKLRNKVTDARTTYEQLEAIAVLSGVAPLGPGSRDIAPGPWAYAGNGFYMRALPSGYPRTTIEVIRPAPYTLERDDKGRIVVFRSGKYRVETSYDDSPGANVVSAPGQPDIHIWHFKKIRYAGPNPGEERVIENRGWILASPHQVTTQPMSPPLRASGLIQLASLKVVFISPNKTRSFQSNGRKRKSATTGLRKLRIWSTTLMITTKNKNAQSALRAKKPLMTSQILTTTVTVLTPRLIRQTLRDEANG